MKKRNAALELLRIIAMLMVIMLHYINKGQAFPNYEDAFKFGANGIVSYLYESLSYVAVNIYVMISGYFLVTSDFHFDKVFKIWFQVFFYSALIYAAVLCFGNPDPIYLSKFWALTAILPITAQHYWFASIYLFMFVLSPFMAVIARRLKKSQFLSLIVILMLLFSRVWRLVLPQSSPIDDRGYGILWFITLFFTSAYIRLHVKETASYKKYLWLYLLFSLCNVLTAFGMGFISEKTGKYSQLIFSFYEYNAPFTILSTICLFLFFRNMQIKSEKLSGFIVRVGELTFGVYLIHEHFILRDLWVTLWNVPAQYTSALYPVFAILNVILVFVIAALIDALRLLLFKALYKTRLFKTFFEKLRKLDRFFPDSEV